MNVDPDAYPGRSERALAKALVERTSADRSGLSWRDLDLRPALEHTLYLALRTGAAGHWSPASRLRPLARLAHATVVSRRPCAGRPSRIVVLVTQPVHVELFDRVRRHLSPGTSTLVVDGRTGADAASPLRESDCRLLAHLAGRDLPSLAAHAALVDRAWRRPPTGWADLVDRSTGQRLTNVARRALPVVALDMARVKALLIHAPAVLACFSELGRLSRIVPPVGARYGVPVVDLPHAEAADPWGSAGMPFDGIAVYGPRARDILLAAGLDARRIEMIGPLAADDLVVAGGVPNAGPRRVIFASQPADPARPALHPDVKRAALRSAVAVAHSLRPSRLIVVPHPTENDSVTDEYLVAEPPAEGVDVHVERQRRLREVLPAGWVLVTASSQSVFEAVIAGVPAITVNPTGGPDPVSFVRDGLAAGATSPEQAARIGSRLLDPDERRRVAEAAKAALGERLGPLDGGAAARAARWLEGFVAGDPPARRSADR